MNTNIEGPQVTYRVLEGFSGNAVAVLSNVAEDLTAIRKFADIVEGLEAPEASTLYTLRKEFEGVYGPIEETLAKVLKAPVQYPKIPTRFMALRKPGTGPIQSTSLCMNHYNDPGRRNYAEQVAGEFFSDLEWFESKESTVCHESDERALECGDSK